jgi:hypothetical protein
MATLDRDHGWGRDTDASATTLAALRSEGLAIDALGTDGVGVANTANRSVLGGMNDLSLQCDYAIEDANGLDRLDVDRLNRRLRRTLLVRSVAPTRSRPLADIADRDPAKVHMVLHPPGRGRAWWAHGVR